MNKIVSMFFIIMGIVGCQTKGPKYMPSNGKEGYSQEQTGDTMIASYKGASGSSKKEALDLSNFRAVEICREMNKKIVVPFLTEDGSRIIDGKTFPEYKTEFICSDKFYSTNFSIRQLDSSEVKHVVSDLMGVLQVMAVNQDESMIDVGDFIVRVDGKRVQTIKEYVLISQKSLTKKIDLTIVRNNKTMIISQKVLDKTEELSTAQNNLVKNKCQNNSFKGRYVCNGGIIVAQEGVQNLGSSYTEVTIEYPKQHIADIVQSEYQTLYKTDENAGLKFGLGLSFPLTSTLDAKYNSSATMSGITVSGSENSTDDIDKGIGVSLNLRNLLKESNGFISSFEYSPKRDGDGFSVTTYSLKGNYAYRFDEIYLFLGGNLALNKIDYTGPMITTAGMATKYNSNMGVGYQLGAGVLVDKNIALEAEYEALKVDSTMDLSLNGNSENYKVDGYIKNLKLSAKLFFN